MRTIARALVALCLFVSGCTSSELGHRMWQHESGAGEARFERDRALCLRDSGTPVTAEERRMGYARPSDALRVDEEYFTSCMLERGWDRRV